MDGDEHLPPSSLPLPPRHTKGQMWTRTLTCESSHMKSTHNFYSLLLTTVRGFFFLPAAWIWSQWAALRC